MEIVQTYEGELRVSSEIVAERTEIGHRAVLQLIAKHSEDFEAFGPLAFEMRPLPGGGNPVRIAHLNEQQATLLITYMRNSEIVRVFKLELVKQFYEMRMALESPGVQELDEARIVQRALQITYRRQQELEAKVEEDAPKVAYVERFVSEDDDIVQFKVAAQQLGIRQKELRDGLVAANWVYRTSIGKEFSTSEHRMVERFEWRAYADHAEKFSLLPQHNAPRYHNGQVRQTLYIKSFALPKIAKKLGLDQLGGV